ncbi:hypothetical protein EDB85DRAFT_1897447 [Lactarius pseudohatsudake]|nr:hypothetical protein EDB85DRAFT_1897447 [Lactarius pseudohatsudake]
MASLPPTTTISPLPPINAKNLFSNLACVKFNYPHLSDYLCKFLHHVIDPMVNCTVDIEDDNEDQFLYLALLGKLSRNSDSPDFFAVIAETAYPPTLTPTRATLASLSLTPPAPPPTKPSAQPTPKPSPPPYAHPPKVLAPVQAPKPTHPTPSYASTTHKLVRPSLIASKKLTHEAAQPLAVHHSPSDICAHLNATLSASHPEVSLSAVRWTKNNNLVVVAGPDTTAHQLNTSSHFISDTLSSFLSRSPSEPLPVSAKENVRWSHLLINNLPTGVTTTCGAYSPQECQDTLACDNPVYQSLRLTRLPSWVKHPDGYAVNSSSSLVVTFEDPTGATLQELLSHRSLFALGHQGHLKCWKQKPHAKASLPPTDRPLVPT